MPDGTMDMSRIKLIHAPYIKHRQKQLDSIRKVSRTDTVIAIPRNPSQLSYTYLVGFYFIRWWTTIILSSVTNFCSSIRSGVQHSPIYHQFTHFLQLTLNFQPRLMNYIDYGEYFDFMHLLFIQRGPLLIFCSGMHTLCQLPSVAVDPFPSNGMEGGIHGHTSHAPPLL